MNAPPNWQWDKRRREGHPTSIHATYHPPLTHALHSRRYRLRAWALVPSDLDSSPGSEPKLGQMPSVLQACFPICKVGLMMVPP